MKKISVFANCAKPSAGRVLELLGKKAREMGMTLAASEPVLSMLGRAEAVPASGLAAAAPLMLVLGGDGTLIRAFHSLRGRELPLFGINLGGLGFLTGVAEQNLEKALSAIAADKYVISPRTVLDCVIRRARGGAETAFSALNDIVIDRGASSRIMAIDVAMNSEPVTSGLCDGLVISTPTGSTGHSLSAGGPILCPGVSGLVLTFICPHSLGSRPLVVQDSGVVSARVARCAGEARLAADGQEGIVMREGDEFEVRLAKTRALLAQLPGFSYFALLQQKLHWRGSVM